MTEPGEPERGPEAFGLVRLTRLVGSFVAPTTLLTGLLYVYGWNHAYWFFDVYGVNSTVLGFSTADYMLRSVDALFVPVTVTATVGLLALWGHSLLRTRLTTEQTPALLRYLLPAMAVIGLAMSIAGMTSIFTHTFLSDYLTAAPLTLAVGVLLLAYTRRLHALQTGRPSSAPTEVAAWAIVFVLVAVGLYWATVDYAAAVGTRQARLLAAELPGEPSVTIFSEHSLSLGIPGVRETACRRSQAEYRFRYDGLKLIIRSGDQYVLLPEYWRASGQIAILLPRTAPIRLEFLPRNIPRPTDPTC